MFWFYSAKEEGERKVKPLSWKKMMMGREVVFVSVGTKRRNQRLREGLTMMSKDLMPFTGLGFGLALTLRRERERERENTTIDGVVRLVESISDSEEGRDRNMGLPWEDQGMRI